MAKEDYTTKVLSLSPTSLPDRRPGANEDIPHCLWTFKNNGKERCIGRERRSARGPAGHVGILALDQGHQNKSWRQSINPLCVYNLAQLMVLHQLLSVPTFFGPKQGGKKP